MCSHMSCCSAKCCQRGLFPKTIVVVYNYAHTKTQTITTHCGSLYSTHFAYQQIERIKVVARLVAVAKKGFACILRC